ncbi:L,D-transpeptidase family protein [Paenibacillus cisolokensis]|uniref:L,D-transpeptidase n=1 Tax=Paenibacillus cisolokensis TaxID=1658519 RepID=UPI003D2ABF28
MKNSLYLKRYVEMHPDNKMAWYLLGKEYEQAGEQGKANYCYNRAEEVYEAFELSKVPSDIWKNYEARLLQMEKEREKRRRRMRRMLLALMLLLLAFIPAVKAPGVPSSPEEILASINSLELADPGADREAASPSRRGPLFTAVAAMAQAAGAGGGPESTGPLPALLSSPDQLPPWSVALGMERSGDWLRWSRDMPRLYGVHRASSGAIAIEPYEGAAAECVCEPADSSSLKQAAAKWADLQLETAVLSEAASQFRARHGRLPHSLDELTQPFPDNWLAGRSPAMEAMFDPLMEHLAGLAGRPEEDGGEAPLGQWGTSPDGLPYFTEPLEVIIDRKHHRLAVVSGSILIRNYEVGLGGAKTPLGQFQIDVKVVNPNGTTKGPYGTRGMQLSNTDYAIHGTYDLDSIGANESEGCIRMSIADVEELFDLVPMGTPVKIQDGGLPGEPLVPKERFKLKLAKGQQNPSEEYHWLD